MTLTVLYDSAVIHSFISHDCVNRLKLPVSELLYILLIPTLTDKPVRTSRVYLNSHFQINGRSFLANLICLPLSDLDLILGMDRLSANHVMLNYSKKSVVFSPVPVEPVKSIYLYLSYVELGCCKTENQGYILLLASMVEHEIALGEIPIVKQYLDVFSEDISKVPSIREIEFSIELVPRMGPISIASHRMSSLELTKLKD